MSTQKSKSLPAHIERTRKIYSWGSLLALPGLATLSVLLFIANRQTGADAAEYVFVLIAPFALPSILSPILFGIGLYLMQYERGAAMTRLFFLSMIYFIGMVYVIRGLL